MQNSNLQGITKTARDLAMLQLHKAQVINSTDLAKHFALDMYNSVPGSGPSLGVTTQKFYIQQRYKNSPEWMKTAAERFCDMGMTSGQIVKAIKAMRRQKVLEDIAKMEDARQRRLALKRARKRK